MNLEEMPPMWVMVEGPDGAGKSTAARTIAGILSENSGPTILHKTRAGSRFEEYMIAPLHWRDSLAFHVVQDRGAVSAAAYEPVKPHPLHPAIIELIPEIVKRDCVLIHVTASLGDLTTRVNDRGDAYIKSEMLADIKKGYDGALELWENAGGRIYEFDTTDGEFPTEPELRFALATLAVGIEGR